MIRIAACILGLLFAQTLYAGEIDISTKVEDVTVYHSGALVTRSGTANLQPGVNELVFRNLSSKIILNSLKISNKEVTILNKSIIRKLTPEEHQQLLDKKDALNKQMSLIEAKYNEVGFVGKVEELEKMTAFYLEKTLQIKKDIREVDKMLEDARKLEQIELKNEDAAILKLVVSVDGTLHSPLRMQYVCGGIGWSPAYNIVVESSAAKTIEMKYLARIMSQTGEDWDDVIIHLSSSFPLEAPTDLPKPKSPWVLESVDQSYNPNIPEPKNSQAADDSQIQPLEGVKYKEINVPSFLELRTLKDRYSIKSNSTVFTFPVETVNLPARYYYFGFPNLDPEVYLVAEVTGWDTLDFVDGVANITYHGNEVGKSLLKFSESRDTLLLPVGKDNSVFMKRTEIADQKYFKITTIGRKRKTTLAYRFELKNNNPFPVQFELADQVPISQTRLAEVEIDKTSDGNLDKESGEVSWNLTLDPKQSEEKDLIFTIEMDSDYKYYNSGSRAKKWRRINCPDF
jgi:uncharacterized protein (TIGR02231 family)